MGVGVSATAAKNLKPEGKLCNRHVGVRDTKGIYYILLRGIESDISLLRRCLTDYPADIVDVLL